MNQRAGRRSSLALRLAAAAVLFVTLAGVVSAQEGGPAAQTPTTAESSFWLQLLQNLFNSRGMMMLLGQPEYTATAFIALNLIVFVETGLFVGFFLPGDSLLVTAGLIAANPACGWNLPLLLATLCASAIVGDTVGYWVGFKTGPAIFSREKSLLFNKDHLLKAQQFYERHGGKTIILARFMPILRTFAPVVAGVGRMEYRRFILYNVVGGLSWVLSMVLTGYFLPSLVNPLLAPVFGAGFQVQDHIEKVVILVVLVSISPGIVAWLRSRMTRKPESQPELVEAK